MENFQYMRIHLKYIPHKLVLDYSLLYISDTCGYVYVQIRKNMYELKEANIIS